ncbi:hypothetical protein Q8791_30775 [Nocardiopsis sp. CT-R113]|uniref:Uncharacterized protein n=1 Tax=Nocardiopsis codii TaxID=3065942 RepID=A0ABU7KH97_9ACTN|nr:hypothetical protein [Nocardiopsis sp. CT-R113]MEE2041614.1 hypothetical protein [Nocardiopsis sp. CT-R113]
MRSAVKITMTALFTAGLLGLGAGAASASGGGEDHGDHVSYVSYEACTKQQNSFGLLNLNLDLLNQCIANYNSH